MHEVALCFLPSNNQKMQNLQTLETPALLLDQDRMRHNIARLSRQLEPLGVQLRAHLKTAKCIEVAREMMRSPQGPATVSTLKEADEFATAGVRDMLYAVSITPNKFAHVSRLRAKGVDLTVVLDSVQAAQMLAAYCAEQRESIPVLIEMATEVAFCRAML
jgi:D-serine deaminase-like pyridoxal phosphate-dependent protein